MKTASEPSSTSTRMMMLTKLEEIMGDTVVWRLSGEAPRDWNDVCRGRRRSSLARCRDWSATIEAGI